MNVDKISVPQKTADEIEKLKVEYNTADFFGLADWATFEAGISKGLKAAADLVRTAPTGSALPVAQPSTAVTRQEALDFLGIATRNWSDMPPLSEDDIGDLATGLLWFIAKKTELAKIEAHLRSLVIANPEKALLAALDDHTRMWFLAELTAVASGSIPITEIEAMVLRHLAPTKGGAA